MKLEEIIFFFLGNDLHFETFLISSVSDSISHSLDSINQANFFISHL